MIPAEDTARAASPAATIEPNEPTTVRGAAGSGLSRSVASVTMPRVPSEPTSKPTRL